MVSTIIRERAWVGILRGRLRCFTNVSRKGLIAFVRKAASRQRCSDLGDFSLIAWSAPPLWQCSRSSTRAILGLGDALENALVCTL
ncbi:hypothetical protein D3C77_694880 [compost metagenome]